MNRWEGSLRRLIVLFCMLSLIACGLSGCLYYHSGFDKEAESSPGISSDYHMDISGIFDSKNRCYSRIDAFALIRKDSQFLLTDPYSRIKIEYFVTTEEKGEPGGGPDWEYFTTIPWMFTLGIFPNITKCYRNYQFRILDHQSHTELDHFSIKYSEYMTSTSLYPMKYIVASIGFLSGFEFGEKKAKRFNSWLQNRFKSELWRKIQSDPQLERALLSNEKYKPVRIKILPFKQPDHWAKVKTIAEETLTQMGILVGKENFLNDMKLTGNPDLDGKLQKIREISERIRRLDAQLKQMDSEKRHNGSKQNGEVDLDQRSDEQRLEQNETKEPTDAEKNSLVPKTVDYILGGEFTEHNNLIYLKLTLLDPHNGAKIEKSFTLKMKGFYSVYGVNYVRYWTWHYLEPPSEYLRDSFVSAIPWILEVVERNQHQKSIE